MEGAERPDAVPPEEKKGNHARALELRKQMQCLPSGDPSDPEYRRLRYVRYADDFVLGFIGPKAEAKEIRESLETFLRDSLALELGAATIFGLHCRKGIEMMSGPHRRSRTGTRLLFLGALLLGAMLMVSCGGDGPGAPTGATLEQATYLTENSREGTATLEDGEFREPVAEGSAIELVIRLGKWTTGHIDERDRVDAAAVTVEDPGGSGTFSYLHALVDDDGELSDAAVAFLGDRIRVEGVSIHDGVITVAMFDRAPHEPFAEPPTIAVIRQFRLEAGTLVEQDLSDAPAYTKAFVRQAMNLYVALGLEETVAYYNAQESVDGQWYVFIIDQDGYTIAHHNPQFRGRDPSLRVDATGYFYGDDLLSATEAGHWVDYVLLNPESGENRQKHTWIVRHDGLLFGSGWYE